VSAEGPQSNASLVSAPGLIPKALALKARFNSRTKLYLFRLNAPSALVFAGDLNSWGDTPGFQ